MAGYSGTPLIKKLSIKPGMHVCFLGMPADVWKLLDPMPEGVAVRTSLSAEVNYIHYFAEDVAVLEKEFAALKTSLAKSGMLWISWRKRKKGPGPTEHDVRRIALAHGMVDVKVCAVDEVWSGLKMVFRMKDRGERDGR